MELLQGIATTLRFPSPEDDPVTFASTPKVTVTRDSDGTAILIEGEATEAGAEPDIYFTVDLDGSDIPTPDLLTAVWTDGASSYTTIAEVVGDFACSLKSIEAKFNGTTTEDVATMREIATRSIEDACSLAFRPRYARELRDGTGSTELALSHSPVRRIVAVTVDGVAVELTEVEIDSAGFLLLPSGWAEGRANVEITYIHGYESFPTATLPVRDLAAYLLTPSPTDWHARATAQTGPDGISYTLVTAGVRGASFPLPSVNAFVDENRSPTIA
jgi:hypothetical protein